MNDTDAKLTDRQRADLALLNRTETMRFDSKQDVIRVMLDYMENRFYLAPQGARLAILNRRYGMAFKKFGLTAKDALRELVREGRVSLEEHKQSVVVFPEPLWREHLAWIRTLDPETTQQYLDLALENTFKD